VSDPQKKHFISFYILIYEKLLVLIIAIILRANSHFSS